MIDVCTYLAGSTLADIKATSIRPGNHKYFAHDNVQLSLTYENGSIAHVTYTALGSPSHPKERIEVYAGGTVYTIDDYKRLVIAGKSEQVVDYRGVEKGHKEELVRLSDWLRGEADPPIELACQLETTLATFTAYEQLGISPSG